MTPPTISTILWISFLYRFVSYLLNPQIRVWGFDYDPISMRIRWNLRRVSMEVCFFSKIFERLPYTFRVIKVSRKSFRTGNGLPVGGIFLGWAHIGHLCFFLSGNSYLFETSPGPTARIRICSIQQMFAINLIQKNIPNWLKLGLWCSFLGLFALHHWLRELQMMG